MHAGSGALNRAYPQRACEQQFEISGVREDDQPEMVWPAPNPRRPNIGSGATSTDGRSIGGGAKPEPWVARTTARRAIRPSRSLNDENLIPPRNLRGCSGASPYHHLRAAQSLGWRLARPRFRFMCWRFCYRLKLRLRRCRRRLGWPRLRSMPCRRRLGWGRFRLRRRRGWLARSRPGRVARRCRWRWCRWSSGNHLSVRDLIVPGFPRRIEECPEKSEA
jgi:hypothetical protein